MSVSAASWVEPERFDTATAAFPPIEGCDRLPFGPSLVIEPTNHRAGAPTGLDVTARAPASDGVEVLEPSQTRDVRVALPEGLAINTGSADGLEVCDENQVHLGKRIAADCPDAAKLAEFEADISALPRRLKGAVYLRDPEPGNPFRFWAVADDLGIHVKLEGTLSIDKETGRIESALLDLPQAPLREVKLVFKSGFRSPLVNPPDCGTFTSTYDFAPWSGGPSVSADAPMRISEGCQGSGGFAPRLNAGTLDPTGGEHSPFLFTLIREDGEQNPLTFDVTPPVGLAATFADVARCEGAAAERGDCPAASQIGKAIAAVGAGPAPLWVPQPGRRPINVYLSGPYKGAPTSIVAVVPRQAGPFDFGDEVVRSAIYVDPLTARATARTDPLPQLIEGIPIRYRTIHVDLNRPGFVLNPTGCGPKATEGLVSSTTGAQARPTSPFEAVDCARLKFAPRLSFKLSGGHRRGGHPSLRSVIRPRAGQANIGSLSVALPHSEFLDQAHIKTICTRVQFAAKDCPPGSIYGKVTATTPLLDQPLSGNIYLRSSSHLLPDMVAVLKGPDSFPLEIDAVGRIDSINGGVRVTFESIPDAPVEKIVASFPGGQKGLLENSTNLCKGANRVTAKLGAQNGRRYTARPPLDIPCAKRGR